MVLVTNQEFLEAVFGKDAGDAHVCGFAEDPGIERAGWFGNRWSRWSTAEQDAIGKGNAYFAISLMDDEPGTGRAVRQGYLFRSCHAIVLDDIGTKITGAALGKLPEPTWKLETSPGCFQWGYRLKVAEKDVGRVSALIGELARLGLTDGGAQGAVRYMRMPVGRNRKAAYRTASGSLPGVQGFEHVLAVWEPGREFDFEDLARLFGIALPTPGTGAGPQAIMGPPPDPGTDSVFKWLLEKGRVLGGPSGTGWYRVRCPWEHEHGDTGRDSGAGYGPRGKFNCCHGHCQTAKRRWHELERWVNEQITEETFGLEELPGWGFDRVPGYVSVTKTVQIGVAGSLPGTLYRGDEDPYRGRNWLVDRMLPETGIALISGQSRAGKTFVALDLAAAIGGGAGQMFAGTEVDRPGGVLFVAAESAGELPIRWKAVLAARGLPDDSTPMVWTDRPPGKLLEPGGPERFAELARQARDKLRTWRDVPLVLIIVDTLAVAGGWIDENDNAEAQRAMSALRVAGDAVGALVVAVDHFGKDAGVGTRGASAKGANADAVLAVLADIDPNGGVSDRRMAVAKCKGAQEGGVRAFDLLVQNMGLDAKGRDVTTCVVGWAGGTVQASRSRPKVLKLRAASAGILRTLRAMGGRADETALRARCDDERAASTAEDKRERARTFDRGLAVLLEREMVAAGAGEIWVPSIAGADFSDDVPVKNSKPNGHFKPDRGEKPMTQM